MPVTDTVTGKPIRGATSDAVQEAVDKLVAKGAKELPKGKIGVKEKPSTQRNKNRRAAVGQGDSGKLKKLLNQARAEGKVEVRKAILKDGTSAEVECVKLDSGKWVPVTEVQAGHKYDAVIFNNTVGKYFPRQGEGLPKEVRDFQGNLNNYFLQEGVPNTRAGGRLRQQGVTFEPAVPGSKGPPPDAWDKWETYVRECNAKLAEMGVPPNPNIPRRPSRGN